MSFQGKVALVTGGTSGIGQATALRFAREGAKVVVSGRRQAEGEAVADQIQSAGGNALFIQADVAQEAQVKHLIAETVQAFGRIDIAFNNAGVEHQAAMTEFDENEYRFVFDINVLGVFLCMKYELAEMLKQGGGVITNTTSVLGHIASPGTAIYNASKHAVEGITKTAALEYAAHNIRVNAVAPAATATDMIDRVAGVEGTEARAQLIAMHPMGRAATADEIADAVAYLASDAASFTTGISLPVDGGLLAK